MMGYTMSTHDLPMRENEVRKKEKKQKKGSKY